MGCSAGLAGAGEDADDAAGQAAVGDHRMVNEGALALAHASEIAQSADPMLALLLAREAAEA